MKSLNEKYALVNGFLQNYLLPVFIPVKRGRRAKAVLRKYSNKDKTKNLEVAMFEQLDVADQDLFLATLSFCGDGEQGTADELLDADGFIKGMPSIKVEVTAYELLRRSGRQTGGKDRRWLAQSLRRLSHTGMRFEGEKAEWGVNLLNYSFVKDDFDNPSHVRVWINPIAAMVFTGGQQVSYIRHSLIDRLALPSEAAKVLHGYLVGMIRAGGSRVFEIGTLVDRVYPDPAPSERASRKRRTEVRSALKSIGDLHGWTVEVERDKTLVSRAKNSK